MTRHTAAEFVEFLETQLREGAGYIMGSRGQNPRTGSLDLTVTDCKSSWKPGGYYYAGQYSGKQLESALKWRETSKRVFDCNGLMEGFVELTTGENINSKARFNYAQWCDLKGSGTIPVRYRLPGAAVFWSNGAAGDIHHVAYLYKPVDEKNPDGDWYLIEARGVSYGVVKTKLLSRKPNFWGLMTKYLDYAGQKPKEMHLGDRTLRNGMEGNDVSELQTALIGRGYDCGRWGVDGDFGDATEIAVMDFQRDHALEVDGIVGKKTVAALETPEEPPEDPKCVRIVGGNCWVRAAPNTDAEKFGVAHAGDLLVYGGQVSENGWHLVEYKGKNAWVSGKYSRLVEA